MLLSAQGMADWMGAVALEAIAGVGLDGLGGVVGLCGLGIGAIGHSVVWR